MKTKHGKYSFNPNLSERDLKESEARKKYDDKQHSKRLFAKRVRYTFPTAFKGGR